MSEFHAKNKYQGRYDFNQLILASPALKKFVKKNPHNNEDTIDFSDNQSLIELNRALLKHFYHLKFWDIPKGYLVPPIPGRSEYIHHAAELFADPKGLNVLDIGTGANCIYPLIGVHEYNWKCLASDTDEFALKNAQKIVDQNHLNESIFLVHQPDGSALLKNIIEPDEYFDLVICNPPFYSSKREAMDAAFRKSNNLKLKKLYNFKGQDTELWCEGGEEEFIVKMIKESVDFKDNVGYFSSLVSKKEHMSRFYGELKRLNVKNIKTIEIGHGQKKSRILAWSFQAN
jgi:23S rRNA (adenine1618-N6)-methyltransferase